VTYNANNKLWQRLIFGETEVLQFKAIIKPRGPRALTERGGERQHRRRLGCALDGPESTLTGHRGSPLLTSPTGQSCRRRRATFRSPREREIRATMLKRSGGASAEFPSAERGR
jgi:hypothetical protein